MLSKYSLMRLKSEVNRWGKILSQKRHDKKEGGNSKKTSEFF